MFVYITTIYVIYCKSKYKGLKYSEQIGPAAAWQGDMTKCAASPKRCRRSYRAGKSCAHSVRSPEKCRRQFIDKVGRSMRAYENRRCREALAGTLPAIVVFEARESCRAPRKTADNVGLPPSARQTIKTAVRAVDMATKTVGSLAIKCLRRDKISSRGAFGAAPVQSTDDMSHDGNGDT